jgi:hypothetical protein
LDNKLLTHGHLGIFNIQTTAVIIFWLIGENLALTKLVKRIYTKESLSKRNCTRPVKQRRKILFKTAAVGGIEFNSEYNRGRWRFIGDVQGRSSLDGELLRGILLGIEVGK